ncbi:dihydrolipoamide acetyltransferase [Helicobacter pylori NY40]|uniref:Dihydrolipoamide acetyltransferase n=1 Tax=Helicobacter pylori NY40 TaxID=1426844 RepID=A0A060Q007_HELPX|nr:dihydrolipoamide acetyltransferase [Helicobacter pylori NY40]
MPSAPKESVTFRLDNLDSNNKEMHFYARSSLKDLNKGVVAIDFGTKSTTAAYMDENGKYRLLSIGGLVDDTSLTKFENPTIMEFRYKENFRNAYNALDHRPFTEKNHIEVAHEAQKNLLGAQGNHLYRFFSQLKQWAGADEKLNFRDFKEDFPLESFTNCTGFNPIEIYAYCIGRCINNMENGVFLKYFLSYPIKYEKHQAEKIRESFEKGLKKSLPRHVFSDEKTAKTFKVELKASEPCAYAISALKSYGFFKSEKLDKPVYYGVFDFGGGTTDFDFGKWEKSANPKFAYKMTHFSSGGDKYLGGENLLELLAFEAYGQNFQTLKAKDIVIAEPNYDRIDTQRFGSFMQNSREARLNLQTIASKLRPFLEKLDADIIEAIEENEEFEIEGFEKEFKVQLFDRNGNEVEEDGFRVDYKELLNLLKDKINEGVANFFAGFSKVMAENIDNQCRAFHIFLGGNASKSVLVKQAFENAKENQLKAYKQKTSKDDFTFILYELLGTEASDKQILELTGEDVSNTPAYLKPTCKTGVAFGLLESRPKAGGIEGLSIDSNPVFKYDLGIEIEGKFHTRISRDSLKPNEYQIFQTKEEWGGFDGLEIRYSDKPLANTNTLSIHDTQLISIALEEVEEVDMKVCCVDSQSIKVGLFKDDQLIYESEAEKL